jgi:hypothetical protein
MFDGELPITDADQAFVIRRLVGRYATPARKAYLYLFKVAVDAPQKGLIPTPTDVQRAWVDDGQGLQEIPIETALAKLTAAKATAPQATQTPPLEGRKQLMARAVLFSLAPTTQGALEVHLFSRAISYSPKGDREVRERWQREAADPTLWYSAYQPRDE